MYCIDDQSKSSEKIVIGDQSKTFYEKNRWCFSEKYRTTIFILVMTSQKVAKKYSENTE